ncbi:MAG: 16S rRNA (cytidine(1402)-2'-O)-methyltransferase [Candidatus Hydrogenedentes bacterium]|nr:16S rRNA (cytidine(1402)-2'-O)-methyltransferase [Candidatus Hydrogenedentota bacterium]
MGKLYVIGTPIGSIEDISFRAVRVLSEIQLLLCEDTRITRKLYAHFNIPFPKKVLTYIEPREEKLIPQVLEELGKGTIIGLCSDSGMPCISDPGYKLILEIVKMGHEIEVIPSGSAVESALVLSALPTSSYTFKGFSPRKEGDCKKFLSQDKELPHTLVFFESPFRLQRFLSIALEVLGDRQCAVCFEMTKKFQRVYRGFISEVLEKLKNDPLKGEVTVTIAGNHPKFIRHP